MNITDRKLIEAIKETPSLVLTLADGTRVKFEYDKKLHHDVALAYQSAILRRK